MIHGPCGQMDPNRACMNGLPHDADVCAKKFPKPFQEETIIGEDSFARYKRPDDGRTVEKNGCILDNRWVVPYSPFLLLKYQAHINIEYCASVKSVKYLYKYVYKGHDGARMMFDNEGNVIHDEISKYVEMRYVI